MAELKTLRERIAAHPNDDVALTQLGDMYLAANRFAEAIPLYRRALRANPHNVAAQAGLSEARDALQTAAVKLYISVRHGRHRRGLRLAAVRSRATPTSIPSIGGT